jgi:hypothetical protein
MAHRRRGSGCLPPSRSTAYDASRPGVWRRRRPGRLISSAGSQWLGALADDEARHIAEIRELFAQSI